MKKKHSILFPNAKGVQIFLFTYATGMRRVLSLSEAKTLVLGAVLRGDMVYLDTDVSPFVGATAEVVSIVDKTELEHARKEYAAKEQS